MTVTVTVTSSPPSIPTARVHRHVDDLGPFWVAVCSCTWESCEYGGPDGGVNAEYAKALHDAAHIKETTWSRS